MGEKKLDRRVRKTQKLLKQGLCNLLKEKSLKNITIKDITDNVDLNRSTFYLHYTDIENLLAKMEDDFLCEFQGFFKTLEVTLYGKEVKKENFENISRKILNVTFTYLEENFDLAYTLFNHDDSAFFEKFISISLEKTMFIKKDVFNETNELSIEYDSAFNIYGIMGIIRKWVNSNPRPTSTEMSEIMLKFFMFNFFG